MTFAEVASLEMKRRGMSATELAEKSGLTAPYLSKLFNGKIQEPTWTKACSIIDALGLSVDDFKSIQNSEKTSCSYFPATALAPDERELLGDYRSLDPPGRETARAQVRLLAELQAKSAAPPSSSSTAAAESA